MRSNDEYILDFVIPAGPTGPTGPSGLPSLCYVNFDEATTVGNMLVNTSTILPTSSNNYTITSDTVSINQRGPWYVWSMDGWFSSNSFFSN